MALIKMQQSTGSSAAVPRLVMLAALFSICAPAVFARHQAMGPSWSPAITPTGAPAPTAGYYPASSPLHFRGFVTPPVFTAPPAFSPESSSANSPSSVSFTTPPGIVPISNSVPIALISGADFPM